MNNLRLYFAEFIGTYILVFCGTGAIVFNEISGGAVSHVGISAVFGLIVLAMIYSIGELSGAHINPAVTIGFVVAKVISIQQAIFYIIAQFLGGIMASVTLFIMFPGNITYGETVPSIIWYKAFSIELILTFILMFVIINVATGSKETGVMAGIAIGSTVALESLFCGPLTGASMNPARSLGPAIASLKFSYIWIYLAAPILGSILAVLIHKLLKVNQKNY